MLQKLQKMVEMWMEKYDKDVEQKQKELDILKASKAKDLERLQELTKLVGGRKSRLLNILNWIVYVEI